MFSLFHTNFALMKSDKCIRIITGAVLLNVKVSDERRRCGDACVTFLLGLFRRMSRRRVAMQNRRRKTSGVWRRPAVWSKAQGSTSWWSGSRAWSAVHTARCAPTRRSSGWRCREDRRLRGSNARTATWKSSCRQSSPNVLPPHPFKY